jgi:hypothetical protein
MKKQVTRRDKGKIRKVKIISMTIDLWLNKND